MHGGKSRLLAVQVAAAEGWQARSSFEVGSGCRASSCKGREHYVRHSFALRLSHPFAPDPHPAPPSALLSPLPLSPPSLPHLHLPKDKQSYYNNELASPLTAATGEDNYPPTHP